MSMAKITDAMPRICLCIDNLDRFGHPYVVVTPMLREDATTPHPLNLSDDRWSASREVGGSRWADACVEWHARGAGYAGPAAYSGLSWRSYRIEPWRLKAMTEAATAYQRALAKVGGDDDPGDVLTALYEATGARHVVVRAETAARARWLKDDQWHWTDLGDGKRILRARVAKLAVPAAA